MVMGETMRAPSAGESSSISAGGSSISGGYRLSGKLGVELGVELGRLEGVEVLGSAVAVEVANGAAVDVLVWAGNWVGTALVLLVTTGVQLTRRTNKSNIREKLREGCSIA